MRWAHWGRLGLRGFKVHLDFKVSRALLARRVRLVLRESPVPKARQVPRAQSDSRGLRVLWVRLDLRVPWVPRAHLVRWDLKVSPVKMVPSDHPDLKGFRVQSGSRVPKGTRGVNRGQGQKRTLGEITNNCIQI